MENKSKLKVRKWTQYFASLVVSVSGFALGTSLGWSAVTEVSIRTELGRPHQVLTWIGSMLLLGGALVMLPLPFVLDRLGGKTVMLMAVVPSAAAWVLVCVASQIKDSTLAIVLYCIGQFVVGICDGMFCAPAPIYICEVAQKEMRGTLSVFFALFLTCGILYSFVIGSFTSILGVSIACGIIPVIFGLLLLYIPETPQYLLMKNKPKEAEDSLTWYRGKEYDIKDELEDMQQTLHDREKNDGTFCENMRMPGAKKALLIGIGAMLCQTASGINAITLHMKLIFEETGSTLSSNNSMIITGALQIVSTAVAAVVVDKVGRKFTLSFSMAGMAICHIVLGVYFLYHDKDKQSVKSINWLPLAAICMFFLAHSFGAGPTPWTLMGEIFPNNIKNVAVPICVFLNWSFGFIVSASFQFIVDALNTSGPFWLYSTACALGAVFVVLVCVETKGKSLHEIQTLLAGGK